MQAGADFIKTSTGKVTPAATLPVTLILLEAVRDWYRQTGQRIGVKPAGGRGGTVHTTPQASVAKPGQTAVIRADPLLADGPDPDAILAEGLPGIRIIDPQLGRGMSAAGAATEQQNTQG